MPRETPTPAPVGDEALQSADERAREASWLVARAQSGDVGAFDRLVRRFRPRIYALALHLTGDPNDADDVTQEAFLAAYDHIASFEGRSELFTWLYRIALRRALNHARRRARDARAVDLDDPRICAAIAVDHDGDPRASAELRERYGFLLTAFDGLSPALRTTVVLVTLQGLSHAEAAVVLGTTEGTVSWRIHEARRRLRDAMAKLEEVPRRARAEAAFGPLLERFTLA